MLRRELLIIFGSLVILLVGMAACGVWLLHDVLGMLDHINTQARVIVEKTTRLNAKLTEIELALYRLQSGQSRHLDPLIDNVETARCLLQDLGEHYMIRSGETEPLYREAMRRYPIFEARLSSLATVQDVELARQYTVDALSEAVALRRSVGRISNEAHEHAEQEQREVTARFRWLILGQALGSLLIINIAIIVLLRAAGMVLGPMDKLVRTSRGLTQEHFDYRIQIDGRDEFAELAGAYNDLAERIQTHEQQRMETLSQVALALNHELNNAMAAIEMQLEILGKRAGDERLQDCLRHIRECLHHMAGTVQRLKGIRRIVLTDYLPGTKMLDLQRSTQGPPAGGEAIETCEEAER